MSTHSAERQLDSAAKQIPVDPTSTVSKDLKLAAFELSQFDLQAVQGQPARKWARRFAATLNKITQECS